MRKTLTALLVAGVLLGAACGGGDDGEDEAGGSTEATTSTIPEQDGPYAEFCTRMLQSATPPTDLEAPPEIAEDWALMQEAFQAQQANDQERMNELMQSAGEATQRIMQFLQDNCNIPGEDQLPEVDPGAGGSTDTTAAAG
jgi:hypothetical protein